MRGAKKNSKGSEGATWTLLSDYLEPDQCAQRIESKGTGHGIADVWMKTCALELKYLRNYPTRENSPIVLDHALSISQYRWLNARWRHGWNAFVLLRIRRDDWFLFCAPDSFVLVPGNEVPRARLVRHAIWFTKNGLQDDSLNSHLRAPRSYLDSERRMNGQEDLWKDI